MKAKCFLLSFLFASVFLGSNIVTLSQIPGVSININTNGLTPGSLITVPVVINGTEVGNYNFNLIYDRDVLTYSSATYTGPMYGFLGSGGSANNNYSYNGQLYLKLTFAFSNLPPAPANGVTYSNDTVFLLNFIFNGGTSQFSFFNIATSNTTASQFTYLRATPYNIVNTSTVFNPGIVSGTALDLTSVSAGGDWNTYSTWQENAGGGTKLPNGAYNVVITADPVTINPVSNNAKCYNLTINSGGKLTLSSGKSLNVTGLFTINSNGSFLDQNLNNNFQAIVKRNITGNYSGSGSAGANTIWHYVTPPVSNGVIGTFLGCLLNKWTENSAGGIWDTLYLPLTLPLEVGRGYAVAATPTFGDAVFNGYLNHGDIVRSGLTNSNPNPPSNTGYYGYHLLGNPYPSAFRWDATVARTNVDAAIYLWNGSTYISKLPADNYEIQSVQGFFVHANANGGSVTFNNSNRVHNFGTFLKSTIVNKLDLVVSGNGYNDETSVRFDQNATNGFDGEFDAYKLYGLYDCPQIFSIHSENNLSINTLPDISNNQVIPVGFKTGLSGTFTLSASGFESFPASATFYLTDLITGTVQNLNLNPEYIFSASPANPEHRFNLHFAPVGYEEKGKLNPVQIYSFNEKIYIRTQPGIHGVATLYDLPGRVILTRQIEEGTLNTISTSIPSGYYLIKVTSNGRTDTEKVFIR
jgi:hypothetical protein